VSGGDDDGVNDDEAMGATQVQFLEEKQKLESMLMHFYTPLEQFKAQVQTIGEGEGKLSVL